MSETPKKKSGRGGARPNSGPKAIKRDEEKAQVVRLLKMGGLDNIAIASYIGIGKDTMYKLYKDEMEQGKVHCDAIALGALMQKIIEGDTASILFYCKTRLGFRETKEDDQPKAREPITINIVDAKKPE